MDRIKTLDAFRGIASIMVLLYHYTSRYDEYFDKSSNFNFHIGWLGVPVFFILSGFVITLTIKKCQSIKEFFIKRFIRLYPTYWICMIITFIVVRMSNLSFLKVDFMDFIINLSMFQDVFNVKKVDGSYWSLLPELIFYMLIAIIFFLNKIDNIYVINSFIISIILLLVSLQSTLCVIHIPIFYLPLFFIGIYFYKLYIDEKGVINYVYIFINLIFGTFFYYLTNASYPLFLLFIFFFFIVLIYFLFVENKLNIFGKMRFFVFLGTVSYPLYLIHQNIGYVIINSLEKYFGMSRVFSILIATSCSIFIATIIVFKIEKKISTILKKSLLK